MTAPTETEIRELIEARIARYPYDNGQTSLIEAIEKYFDPIEFFVEDGPDGKVDGYGEVWTDLRPSEHHDLKAVVEAAKAGALDEVRRIIVNEVVAAAMSFAGNHPDASRAEPDKRPVSVGF